MTGELKKRFIDILFEDDVADDELEDKTVQGSRNVNSTVKKTDSAILAKDILYRKTGGSAFINLDEKPNTSKKSSVENKDEEYEMSSQISPMFGLIKENKKTVNTPVKPEITESQTNKPSDSHLDIITSPIYGYGNKEDAQDNDYYVRGINSQDEEELHHLFDEDEYLNNSYENMNGQTNDDEEISLFRLFGENR